MTLPDLQSFIREKTAGAEARPILFCWDDMAEAIS
jgi:hypothetical protein